VFAREPNADERLFAMENVVLAPHYASVTLATRQAIADALHDSIQDFLNGQSVTHDAAFEFRPRAAS